MVLDRERVKEKAKEILDRFSEALEKVKEQIEETFVERAQDRREEGGEVIAIDKEIMFKNAPKTQGDFIIAEKKKW